MQLTNMFDFNYTATKSPWIGYLVEINIRSLFIDPHVFPNLCDLVLRRIKNANGYETPVVFGITDV